MLAHHLAEVITFTRTRPVLRCAGIEVAAATEDDIREPLAGLCGAVPTARGIDVRARVGGDHRARCAASGAATLALQGSGTTVDSIECRPGVERLPQRVEMLVERRQVEAERKETGVDA